MDAEEAACGPLPPRKTWGGLGFWGVVVKPGEIVKWEPGELYYHLSQIALKVEAEEEEDEEEEEEAKQKKKEEREAKRKEQAKENVEVSIQIEGAKIYSDAAWKCNKVPGDSGQQATGIGIFIQYTDKGAEYNIMIQASAQHAISVLQAEAKAMLLAANIAHVLQVKTPTMMIDNQLLAAAVASKKLDSNHMHWNSRKILGDILNATNNLQAQVFHIRREINGVAHNCAHQVLRSSLGPPTLGCSSSAHASPSCHVISVLQNFRLEGFVIHAVHCC